MITMKDIKKTEIVYRGFKIYKVSDSTYVIKIKKQGKVKYIPFTYFDSCIHAIESHFGTKKPFHFCLWDKSEVLFDANHHNKETTIDEH